MGRCGYNRAQLQQVMPMKWRHGIPISEHIDRDWAAAAASTPLPVYNRYLTLPTDEEDAASMNGAFTEAGSRRVSKRRRQQSRASSQQPQQQQQQQYRGSSGLQRRSTNAQQQSQSRGRGRVMLCGSVSAHSYKVSSFPHARQAWLIAGQ